MLTERSTLTQFLIEERRRHPGSSGDLNSLILDVALSCKAISRCIASGALAGVLGSAGAVNVQGEEQKKLDVLANEIFLRANEWGGQLGGMASEEMDDPYPIPPQYPRGKYLLTFDPLDGSSNIDVNVSVGSISSILRAPEAGHSSSPRRTSASTRRHGRRSATTSPAGWSARTSPTPGAYAMPSSAAG